MGRGYLKPVNHGYHETVNLGLGTTRDNKIRVGARDNNLGLGLQFVSSGVGIGRSWMRLTMEMEGRGGVESLKSGGWQFES